MSFWVLSGIALSAYAYALHKRLSTPHPGARAYAGKPVSDEELAKVVVPTPEEIANVIKADGKATGEAYIVVGGGGLVGQYIVRALLARGETLVRILDVVPPDTKFYRDSNTLGHVSRAEFVKTDITDYESVQKAISKPFGNTRRTANVVIHTVAVIRNAERLAYLKDLSYRVNVGGTQNLLRASQELGSVRAFVFTSSAGLFVPASKFLRLGLGRPRDLLVLSDDIPEDALATWNHYCTTKLEADKIVRAADGVKGIRTGVLRPGMAIPGPQSIFYSFYFDTPGPHPAWGDQFASTAISPWDLARAHIMLSDALDTRPDGLAGEAFAITGEPATYTMGEFRHMFSFYSRTGVHYKNIPILPLYIFSHIFEVYFYIRYLALKGLSKITGRPVSYLPQWAIDSKVSYMQPMMWDMSLLDAVVDDSRVRKVLGYRHSWTTAQIIKWTTDILEGRSDT